MFAGKRGYGNKGRWVKYWARLGCWISPVTARSRLARVLKLMNRYFFNFPIFFSGRGNPRITETADTGVRLYVYVCVCICVYIYIYTGCNRRNWPDFGRVFLMLYYTDITKNTYVQSRTVTEIIAREKCGLHRSRRTIRRPWRHTCPMRLPDNQTL